MSENTQEIALLNGVQIPAARISSELDEKRGVFETMKAVSDQTSSLLILGFDRHIDRLISGIQALEISGVSISLESAIALTTDILNRAKCTKNSNIVLRIVVTDNTLIAHLKPWTRRLPEEGAKLLAIDGTRPMAQYKHLSTSHSESSISAAKKNSCDEALFISQQGHVTECSWSNFFWLDLNGCLHTASHSVLPGVTRSIVLNHLMSGIQVSFEDFTLKQVLEEAREAFITNALHGVVPVTSIDGNKIPAGIHTAQLTKEYESLYGNSSLTRKFPLA